MFSQSGVPPPNVAPSLDTSHVSQGSRKALSFPSEEMDCEELYASMQHPPSLPDMGFDEAELANAKAEHDALLAQASLSPPGVSLVGWQHSDFQLPGMAPVGWQLPGDDTKPPAKKTKKNASSV